MPGILVRVQDSKIGHKMQGSKTLLMRSTTSSKKTSCGLKGSTLRGKGSETKGGWPMCLATYIIRLSVCLSVCLSVNQSINQPSNRSINQSIKFYLLYMYVHRELIDHRLIVNDPAISQDLGQEGYHGRQASQGGGDGGRLWRSNVGCLEIERIRKD